MTISSRFESAIADIDAANAADPNTIADHGDARPAELVYGERMTAMLMQFFPSATEALRLAARAQHIRRWTVPRASYPMDRAGYHRWRNDLKRRHAEWASEILATRDYPADEIARVAKLIRKEELRTDPEAQTLEDVACLVFLQHYAPSFASRHPADKVRDILRKTWAKMSERGQGAALGLPLVDGVRTLLAEATRPAERGP
ncbi:MAG: DUF4202 domain-containing protein [Hyphomicrobium sp.]